MNSYSGKMNLLKFKNACIVTVQGKTQAKRGVFIPVDDNNLFISADEDLKPYWSKSSRVLRDLDFMAWENQQPGKYGDTHSLRQSLAKEVRDRMTEDELKAVPYFGNMKPYEATNAAQTVAAPIAQVDENIDDLPF